jgi:cell division protein DivIC
MKPLTCTGIYKNLIAISIILEYNIMEVIVPFRQRHCDEVIRMRKTERKEKKHRKSMRIIALVLVIACLGLGFKTWQVHQEIEEYAVVQEEVSKQISEAEKLQEDIREKLEYQKSDAFIEDIARDKLGLIFENEIIFKKGH